MTIFITGSSGKIATPLTRMLNDSSHQFIVASRKGATPDSKYPTTKFDWFDASTFGLPFEHEQAHKSPITTAFLLAPVIGDPSAGVIDFIKFAKAKGVKRFVLVSQADMDENTPFSYGTIHKSLKESGAEWAVVRPTFFMDNFIETFHLASINDEGKIYTAAGDGRVPFIAASDIAACAYQLLTDETPRNKDFILTGKDSITHDQVATIIGEVLGRKIEHAKQSEKDMYAIFNKHFDEMISKVLTDLDLQVAKNDPLLTDPLDTVKQITGKEPKGFRQWAEEKKQVWKQG